MGAQPASSPPPPPGGGGGGGGYWPTNDARRNLGKFALDQFGVVDTNNAAANDPTLYAACSSFPRSTNTGPNLQIRAYGKYGALLKANHFNYSGETVRDFALLVGNKVETATWKSIDILGSSDSQDGWLVQGIVPHWQVADPMFLLVTNFQTWTPIFFKVVPYGGPLVQLTGPAPNSWVSNTITLHASITDLSGVTNEQFEVDVNGDPTRTNFSSGNTITLDTHYNVAGPENVNFNVAGSPVPFIPTNPPEDAKLIFTGSATLPLNFTNATYLWSASDMCSPDVGTNYIVFGVKAPVSISGTIKDIYTGTTLKTYSGSIPAGYTAASLPWDFTDTSHRSYAGSNYSVSFAASGTTLTITNQIDRQGVRTAAANILAYEQEDPSASAGPYLNSEADKYIPSLATALFADLYSTDFASQTQYSPSDIGLNRDIPAWAMMPLEEVAGSEAAWAHSLVYDLTNTAFSDFGYYAGHANGVGIGGNAPGSHWMVTGGWIDSGTVKAYAQGKYTGWPNWRLRKVVMWACYTTSPDWTTASGTYPTWPAAFGIRGTHQQLASWMKKNVGLFFNAELPQAGFSGTLGGTSAEVACDFDILWVGGPNGFPGGCDPTYTFNWAFSQIENNSPEILKGVPIITGFGYLPFTGIYDMNLMTNDISHVKY